MAGERATISPVTVVSAVNVTAGTSLAFAVIGLTSIDTAPWESFRLHINVLSFDGTARYHFKIQHSCIDPSQVSYSPWEDLYEFQPVSDAGIYSVDIPNGNAERFGRWIRVLAAGVGTTGAETVSLGDIIVSPRG